MRRILLGLSVLILTIVISLFAVRLWLYYNPPFVKGQDQPVAYNVLKDNGDTRITISVDAHITERQLYATLSQVADKSMFDGRDYLFGEYLWVDAYLIKDGKLSSQPAASLRRYVPNINPNYKETWELDSVVFGRYDRFSENLQQARREFEP